MDRSLEAYAAELFARSQYAEAAQVYSQCLETTVVYDQIDTINVLLNRAACYLKLSNYVDSLADCDHVLKLDTDNEKALWKKIKVLCFQGSFVDGHNLAKEWHGRQPDNALAQKELSRLDLIMGALGGGNVTIVPQKIGEDEPSGERVPPEGREDSKAGNWQQVNANPESYGFNQQGGSSGDAK